MINLRYGVLNGGTQYSLAVHLAARQRAAPRLLLFYEVGQGIFRPLGEFFSYISIVPFRLTDRDVTEMVVRVESSRSQRETVAVPERTLSM